MESIISGLSGLSETDFAYTGFFLLGAHSDWLIVV